MNRLTKGIEVGALMYLAGLGVCLGFVVYFMAGCAHRVAFSYETGEQINGGTKIEMLEQKKNQGVI